MKKYWYLHLCLIFGFLLGVHNGYIALWQEGEQEPVKVFPYMAHMLPQQDQQRLENGIPISDERHLYQLLEDYLS